MITGTREDLKAYKGLSERIDKAIDFILNIDENIENGRYEIDGDNIYVNVMEGESSSMDEIVFEAHKKYLDLQYVISGSEVMVYAPITDCTVKKDYNEEGDYWLFSGEGSPIKIDAGKFYLVHPFDCHAPCKGYEKTTFKKAVAKIKL